jgi:hypothetical protein
MSFEAAAEVIQGQLPYARRWGELTRAEQRAWTDAVGLGITMYLAAVLEAKEWDGYRQEEFQRQGPTGPRKQAPRRKARNG